MLLDATSTTTPEEGYDFHQYGQMDFETAVDFTIVNSAHHIEEFSEERTDIEYYSGFVPRAGGSDLYSIGGNISKIGSGDPMIVGDVRITDLTSGTVLATVPTDLEGNYVAYDIPSGTYAEVRPITVAYLFHPTHSTLTIDSDKTLDFLCEEDEEDYRISGSVSGDIQEGVNIHLRNAVTGSFINVATTDDTGYYVFNGLPINREVLVRPLLTGYTFDPPEERFFILGNKSVDFTATVPDDVFKLSGTVTEDSVPVEGLLINLYELPSQLPIGSDTTDSAGYYEFDVIGGSEVRVRPYQDDYFTDPAFVELTIDADTVQDFTAEATSATDWIRTNGSSGEESGYAVTYATEGYQFVGGMISGGGESGNSAYVERRSAYGVINWCKKMSISGDFASCWINDLEFDSDSNELLGTGYVYPGGGGGPQAWVFRMSEMGELLQSRTGPDTDVTANGTGIARLADGDYYVVGTGTDSSFPSTGQDVLAMKFDGTTHAPEWVVLLEGDEYEAVGPCGIDGDGNLVVAGIYDSGPPTDDDFMIAKFLPDGSLKWAGVWDVMFDNTALTGLCIGPSNEVYLVGGRQGLPVILRVSDSTTNGSLDWARTWDYPAAPVQSHYFEDCAYNIAASSILVCGRHRDDTSGDSNGLLLEFDATALNVLNHAAWVNPSDSAGTQFKAMEYDSSNGLIYLTGVTLDKLGSWEPVAGTINAAPPMSTRSYSGSVTVLTPNFTDLTVTVTDYVGVDNDGGGGGDAISGRRTGF